MVFTTFEELKNKTEGKKIGWIKHSMLNPTHAEPESFHQGYLDCVAYLEKTNDIVIVDLFNMGMLLHFLWKGRQAIDDHPIDLEAFGAHVGNAHIFHTPPAEYLRQLVDMPDIEKHRYLLGKMADKYKTTGAPDRNILKTNMSYYYSLDQEIPIHETTHTWECGFRSFHLQDYINNNLNMRMTIRDPGRKPDGVLPGYTSTPEKVEISKILMAEQSATQGLKERLEGMDTVSDVHHSPDFIEVFLTTGDRVVNSYVTYNGAGQR